MFDMAVLLNDVSTMERVCKVVDALWSGKAQLISAPNDDCLAFAVNGEWLYFIGEEDSHMTPEEATQSYSVFEIAQMVVDTICNLEDDDYDFFCEALEF